VGTKHRYESCKIAFNLARFVYLHVTQQMIRCTPKGICSWNFAISGESHSANLEFQGIRERGKLIIDNESFEVTKLGVFSGTWTLTGNDSPIYTAHKPSAFTRAFQITGPSCSAQLAAESALSRTMKLTGNAIRCTIAPDHCFTRRATITGTWEDFRLLSFGFWLTLVTWRRATNKSG